MKAFYEVGNALLQIRDSRLYREQYKTFEEYCREKWNLSRPRAYQLIESAVTVEALSTVVDKKDIPPEFTIRPLSNLEPEQRAEVYQQAVDTAPEGKVTAILARLKAHHG